jgi:hypothetical protein
VLNVFRHTRANLRMLLMAQPTDFEHRYCRREKLSNAVEVVDRPHEQIRLAGAQTLICPGLRWNQERYGDVLRKHLYTGRNTRWLETGCGHRVLPNGLESMEKSVVRQAAFVVGIDMDWRSLLGHRSIGVRVKT